MSGGLLAAVGIGVLIGVVLMLIAIRIEDSK